MMVPERNRGLLWCSKSRVPSNVTDADGYQTGCIWLNTDGAAGTCVWVNEGSVTVASWVAADTSAGDAAGTVQFDDAITGPLISIETTDQEGDAYLNPFLITGTYASACKKGIMLSASNPRPVTFLFDNHSVALGAADYRAVLSRVYICSDQANALTLNAMRAQIKLADGVDISNAGSVTAPFTGYFELAGTGARNLDGHVACVRAALEEGASGITTIDINLCGYEATLNSSRTYAGGGYLAAFAANISGGTSKWQYGLYVDGSAVTQGVVIGSSTVGVQVDGTPDYAFESFAEIATGAQSVGNVGASNSRLTIKAAAEITSASHSAASYNRVEIEGGSTELGTGGWLEAVLGYVKNGSGSVNAPSTVVSGVLGVINFGASYVAGPNIWTAGVMAASYSSGSATIPNYYGFAVVDAGGKDFTHGFFVKTATSTVAFGTDGCTNLLSVPVAGTAPVVASATTAGVAAEGSISILVNGVEKFLQYFVASS